MRLRSRGELILVKAIGKFIRNKIYGRLFAWKYIIRETYSEKSLRTQHTVMIILARVLKYQDAQINTNSEFKGIYNSKNAPNNQMTLFEAR
jgi:hypothetical protein